jgi:hypothetical protein
MTQILSTAISPNPTVIITTEITVEDYSTTVTMLTMTEGPTASWTNFTIILTGSSSLSTESLPQSNTFLLYLLSGLFVVIICVIIASIYIFFRHTCLTESELFDQDSSVMLNTDTTSSAFSSPFVKQENNHDTFSDDF